MWDPFQTSMRTIRAHGAVGASSDAVEPAGALARQTDEVRYNGGAHASARAAAAATAQRRRALAFGLALALGLPALAAAESRPDAALPRVVGVERADLVMPGDTLLDVAFRNNLGYEAVARLNPTVDTWLPEPGTIVKLPSRVIVPDVEADGIVINVPEMRLFDFTVEGGPEILAVAVGDADDPTPIGDFRVGQKRIDPVWYVPESILAERPGHAERVPAGPDNPLGSRWLRIGNTSYGIHGTNTRWSIGREATHGCVRLFEHDVRRLYARTPEGTRLQIIYQPYKWGSDGHEIFFEAHPDLYGRVTEPLVAALAPMRARGLLAHVDVGRVWQVLEDARGVPVAVGTVR